jgi:hypothetical protein
VVELSNGSFKFAGQLATAGTRAVGRGTASSADQTAPAADLRSVRGEEGQVHRQEELGVHNGMQEFIRQLRAYEQEHNDCVLEVTVQTLFALRGSAATERLQALCHQCELCLAVSSAAGLTCHILRNNCRI